MTTFDTAISCVLTWEGGESDDPADAGGLTKYGISQRAYPTLDIDALTEADAVSIYHRDFWLPMCCDDLSAGVALFVFDTAVNMGTSAAAALLQMAAGVRADCVIGPITIAAVKGADQAGLLCRMASLRIIRYSGMGGWVRFAQGWVSRVLDTFLRATTA